MPIIPAHSRTVKVITSSEFPDIEQLVGSITYETTSYCVYLNAESDRVIGVFSIQGIPIDEPFIRITEIEELAPNAPKYLIRDPSLDVANILAVLCWMKEHEVGARGPEINVFVSKHDHITFTYVKAPLTLPKIQMIDVIPPSPSKSPQDRRH